MRVIDAGPIRHADIERFDDSDLESGLEGAGHDTAHAEYRLIEVDVSEIEDTTSFPLQWTPTTTVEALQRGDALPPVVVVRTDRGRGFGLIDGLNRVYAHWLVGPSTMRAYELLPGSHSRAVAQSSLSRASLRRLRWGRRFAPGMSRAVASSAARDPGRLGRFGGRRPAIAVALLAIGGLAVGLVFALRPSPGFSSGPGGPHPLGASTQAGKLSVSIPRGFYVYTLRGGIYPAGTRPPVIGHVLTDLRLPAGTSIAGVLDQWATSGNGPPSDKVALELKQDWTIGPGFDQLHLPLSPKQAWFRQHLANGTDAGYRYGDVRFDNFDYNVMYWRGPAAPANDRVAVLRALRSIRPTR